MKVILTLVFIISLSHIHCSDKFWDEENRPYNQGPTVNDSILDYVAFEDYASLESLLKCGVDVNFYHAGRHTTPLHLAVQSGNEQMVELLLSNKAYVNYTCDFLPDNSIETPLEMAMRLKHYRIADLLRQATDRRYKLAIRPHLSLPTKLTFEVATTIETYTVPPFHKGKFLVPKITTNSQKNVEKPQGTANETRAMQINSDKLSVAETGPRTSSRKDKKKTSKKPTTTKKISSASQASENMAPTLQNEDVKPIGTAKVAKKKTSEKPTKKKPSASNAAEESKYAETDTTIGSPEKPVSTNALSEMPPLNGSVKAPVAPRAAKWKNGKKGKP